MVHDLFEYLDMLTLASPRVQSTDKTDPYISRYQVPDLPNDAALALDDTSRAGGNVKTVTWTGFITTQWMLELLCAIM
jgi:ribonuclease P/MRP protein subunit RPP40